MNEFLQFQTSIVLKHFLFIALLFATSQSIAQQKEVTILYTNDIESVYDPIEAFWNDEIELIGGLSYLSTLVTETKATNETTFVFDAGDIFTGALSEVTKGKLPFDIYSHIGYDAIALGNHEFEYGWEQFLKVKQRANFPVLNANIFYEHTDINFCQAYNIIEKDGVRIGLIGLMGLEAFKNTINPAHRQGLEIRDPYPIVQNIIDEIRNEVDLVVLLTHQNKSAPMQTDKEADPSVQRGFDEDFEMAGRLDGVDIIFGGHSDNGLWEPVVHPETGTLICITFGQGKYLGELQLTIENKKITTHHGKLIPVNVSLLESDKKVDELVREVKNEFPHLTEVLGFVDQSGYRKYNQEATIGNLFADLLKEASKADIGLMNPGSLRADLNQGEIKTEEVINIYPFVDQFHVVEITGKALKELLEYSCDLTYGFAQLSGIEMKYNSSFPVGNRVLEVKVNGKPLNLDENYTVASSAFLANGGDGFSMLKNGKLISKSEKFINEYFIDLIRSKKSLTMPSLGRQVDVSKV